MRRFAIFYIEDGKMKRNILALIKEYNTKEMKGYYRFVNLSEDFLLPEKYSTPNQALGFLDKLEKAGIAYVDVTDKYT